MSGVCEVCVSVCVVCVCVCVCVCGVCESVCVVCACVSVCVLLYLIMIIVVKVNSKFCFDFTEVFKFVPTSL